MSEFAVTFWGVRGGRPVSGPGTVEIGGNTTCIEIRAGPHLIVVDAGTGIIGLGAKLAQERACSGKPIVGTMLFTHGHHDHTQGLAFFAPIRFSDSVFDIFGPRVFGEDLDQVLKRAMLPSQYPIALDKLPGIRCTRNVRASEMISLGEPGAVPAITDAERRGTPSIPGATLITAHHSSNHPRDGSFCYRVEHQGKSLVVATDTEGYEGGDRRLAQFAHGTDLLIHDSEYTDSQYAGPQFAHQGWGHSTWRMAVEVGRLAGVKRLALTHHHGRHDDVFLRGVEQEAQAEFPGAFLAYEGLTVDL